MGGGGGVLIHVSAIHHCAPHCVYITQNNSRRSSYLVQPPNYRITHNLKSGNHNPAVNTFKSKLKARLFIKYVYVSSKHIGALAVHVYFDNDQT